MITAATDSHNRTKRPLLKIDRQIIAMESTGLDHKESVFIQLYNLIGEVDFQVFIRRFSYFRESHFFQNFFIPKSSPVWADYFGDQANPSSIEAVFLEISKEIRFSRIPLFVRGK
jgi:hypothetical protein